MTRTAAVTNSEHIYLLKIDSIAIISVAWHHVLFSCKDCLEKRKNGSGKLKFGCVVLGCAQVVENKTLHPKVLSVGFPRPRLLIPRDMFVDI